MKFRLFSVTFTFTTTGTEFGNCTIVLEKSNWAIKEQKCPHKMLSQPRRCLRGIQKHVYSCGGYPNYHLIEDIRLTYLEIVSLKGIEYTQKFVRVVCGWPLVIRQLANERTHNAVWFLKTIRLLNFLLMQL